MAAVSPAGPDPRIRTCESCGAASLASGTAAVGSPAGELPAPKSMAKPPNGLEVVSVIGKSCPRRAASRRGGPSILARFRYPPGVYDGWPGAGRPRGRSARRPPDSGSRDRVDERGETRRKRVDTGRLDVLDPHDHVLRPGRRERLEAPSGRLGRLHPVAAGGRQARVLERRPLDLRVGPPDGLAVVAQDRVLAGDHLRAAEDVRRVRVLGDEAERLLLAAAADHDGRPWPRDRLRGVEQPPRRELRAGEGFLRPKLAAPHPVGDAERLLEHLEARPEGRHREPQCVALLLVPGGPDPEPRASP